jgi:N-acetylhexosamine 1-kinase
VNDSWLVADGAHRYVLQRINDRVFPDPLVAARNFVNASRLLRSRDVRTVSVHPTRSGASWFVDEVGDVWRSYGYVDGRVTRPRSGLAARRAAFAFGAFARALSGVDEVFEPAIPRFHDFSHRIRQFERAVVADRAGRARAAARDIDRLHSTIDTVRSLDEYAQWNRQPVRVVHNDAKPANLLHLAGTRPCVIDLDTIGPGRLGYDAGELVRSTIRETDHDVPCDGDRIEAVWSGFVAGWRGELTRAERDVLAIAGVVLATELATRYLADHLDGDRYFALGPNESNLGRARVQMRRGGTQLRSLGDLRRRAENLLSTRL